MNGSTAPCGALALRVLPRWPKTPTFRELVRAVWRHALPRRGLAAGVAVYRIRNFPNVWRGLWRVAIASLTRIPHFYGALYLDVVHADGSRTPIGLVSLRLVTNAGAGYIVDALQNLVEAENMKFHGFGTGATAEAAGDTALVTELTTQYATDNTRPTGSQAENGAQVYRTVGTLDPDADVAITEHGIFSATSAGVLLDRSVFSAVNLTGASGDALQATYDFTVNSGN
jgi:hypothetical protein